MIKNNFLLWALEEENYTGFAVRQEKLGDTVKYVDRVIKKETDNNKLYMLYDRIDLREFAYKKAQIKYIKNMIKKGHGYELLVPDKQLTAKEIKKLMKNEYSNYEAASDSFYNDGKWFDTLGE